MNFGIRILSRLLVAMRNDGLIFTAFANETPFPSPLKFCSMATYEWNESKRVANLSKHGVDFALVREFDWDTAIEFDDIRMDYGERRTVAFGMINQRLHALVYTLRGDRLRVISLRKANRREIGRYHRAIQG